MRFVFNLTMISFEIDQIQSLSIFFPMQDQSCIFPCFGFVSFIAKTISSNYKATKCFVPWKALIFLHTLFLLCKHNALHF